MQELGTVILKFVDGTEEIVNDAFYYLDGEVFIVDNNDGERIMYPIGFVKSIRFVR